MLKYYTPPQKYCIFLQCNKVILRVPLSHDFLEINDFLSWVGNSFKSVPNNKILTSHTDWSDIEAKASPWLRTHCYSLCTLNNPFLFKKKKKTQAVSSYIFTLSGYL